MLFDVLNFYINKKIIKTFLFFYFWDILSFYFKKKKRNKATLCNASIFDVKVRELGTVTCQFWFLMGYWNWSLKDWASKILSGNHSFIFIFYLFFNFLVRGEKEETSFHCSREIELGIRNISSHAQPSTFKHILFLIFISDYLI